MADPNNCLSYNAPGRFYVDQNCTNCQLCVNLAPNHFISNPNENKSYVVEQPRSQRDLALALQAVATCPQNAIGDRSTYAQYFSFHHQLSAA